jgi:hypothetical protein
MAHDQIEGAMLSHRIIGASAVLLAAMLGSAAAQDQTSAGKPLQLLPYAHREARHETKAPIHPHVRRAEKLAKHAPAKRHIARKAVAKPHRVIAAVHPNRADELAPAHALVFAPERAEPVPAAPQHTVWPAVNSAKPGSIMVPAPPAVPQNVKTEPVISDAPNSIATDGKVAQGALPPVGNAPPVAADPHPAAAALAPALAPAPGNSAAAAPAPAVRAMMASPAAADSDAKSPIGSAPWLLQALAALGGALTAGAVAWFLILRRRSEPEAEEFFADTLAPGE